jgi:hypothetical protein
MSLASERTLMGLPYWKRLTFGRLPRDKLVVPRPVALLRLGSWHQPRWATYQYKDYKLLCGFFQLPFDGWLTQIEIERTLTAQSITFHNLHLPL